MCPSGATCLSESTDWLARNQDNVSEWGDMSIRGLLLQLSSTITYPTKRVGLVQRLNCSRHDIAEKLLNWR